MLAFVDMIVIAAVGTTKTKNEHLEIIPCCLLNYYFVYNVHPVDFFHSDKLEVAEMIHNELMISRSTVLGIGKDMRDKGKTVAVVLVERGLGNDTDVVVEIAADFDLDLMMSRVL